MQVYATVQITMTEIQGDGHVLLFGGPNGAGKDTLDANFRAGHPNATRVVRHITRAPAAQEVDGEDYHFVPVDQFEAMAKKGEFIEYARYIGSMSGTSYAELSARLRSSEFATLTANFEDSLNLRRKLGRQAVSNLCFFVSPVPEVVMQDDPRAYLEALRERMSRRGRSSDLIDGRLKKAAEYRGLYLKNRQDALYVDNSEGRLQQATRTVARAAISLAQQRRHRR